MMQQEELRPEATQVITDVLRPISVAQVITYLEKTGWTLWANHFKRREGWSLHPEIARPTSWVYIKPDPEATNKDDQHFVIEVPGNKEHWGSQSKLQLALERIATVEQTTFITVLCHVLDVEHLVLHPIEERADLQNVDL